MVYLLCKCIFLIDKLLIDKFLICHVLNMTNYHCLEKLDENL